MSTIVTRKIATRLYRAERALREAQALMLYLAREETSDIAEGLLMRDAALTETLRRSADQSAKRWQDFPASRLTRRAS